jgi:AP2 domain
MKIIFLTRGLFTLVDDEDYDYLMQWKWQAVPSKKTYYATRVVHVNCVRKEYRMHRVILNIPDGVLVDHANHNGLINLRSNLRACNHTENTINTVKKESKSQYWGIRYTKKGRIFARIKTNKKLIHLGTFDTEKEAALAYNKAARIYHGEFAKQNIV